MKDKFVCSNCGKTGHVLIDGYAFGDRLLEGVLFKVENRRGKPKCAGVVEGAEYFKKLNRNMWFKACEAYCRTLEGADCPVCKDEEVRVWGADLTRPAPVMITMTDAGAMLRRVFGRKPNRRNK